MIDLPTKQESIDSINDVLDESSPNDLKFLTKLSRVDLFRLECAVTKQREAWKKQLRTLISLSTEQTGLNPQTRLSDLLGWLQELV